ncbi:MAG TPA: glycosyltransferase family 4 protein [Terriglobales bacterium]|nr:glycosyltransferase family 4 protein [Terriglobales bacterium]
MITHSLYESDGRVMRYAEALAARGDEVDVIALCKNGMSREETIAGVHLFRVHSRTFKEQHKLAFLKQVATFFLKASWMVTRRHFRKPYDLLHVHSIPETLVFAAWLPKLTGARVILDIHDILPELYASKFGASQRSLGFKLMLFLERCSIAFSNHVIIANDLWKDRLVSRSMKTDKCSVFLNYPDRRIFRPLTRRSSSDKFVIMYPGTLNRHQGLDVAIRAFNRIKVEVPNAEFHIYGEGRTQGSLVQLVEQLNLTTRVIFKPMLPLRQIASVMANADLAVVPKRKDTFGNEAFSTKILEFMSVGVPVIVSDTKIDRYYFNGSIVQFFQDGDEDDLAKKMVLLITDHKLRQQISDRAFAFVQGFDWESHKTTYLGLVDLLVTGTTLKSTEPLAEKTAYKGAA